MRNVKPTVQLLALVAFVFLVVIVGFVGVPEIGSDNGGEDTDSLDLLDREAEDIQNLSEDDVETHETQLRNAGSYTTELNMSISFESESGKQEDNRLSQQFTVSDAREDALMVAETDAGVQSVYTSGEETLVRLEPVDSPEPKYPTPPLDPVDLRESAGVTAMLVSDNVTYERVGVDTDGDVDVVVFESNESQTVDALASVFAEYPETQNVTVKDFNSTVVVGTDGVIRQFDLSYTFEEETPDQGMVTVTSGIRVSVSDVGSTSVEEPSWVDEAERERES